MNVRVLCCAAMPNAAERSVLRAAITDDEARKLERYVQAIDANRFLVGKGTVRIELGRLLGLSPRDVPLELGEHGKPLVRGGVPHVNVSHAGDVVLVAISGDAPIGIDVEKIDAAAVEPGVVEVSFSRRDVVAYNALASSLRVPAFFHVWATREAVIKAVGAGFSLPPDAFDVSVDPACAPAVLATRAPLAEDASFVVAPIDVPPGHVAMLAVAAPAGTEIEICR